MNKREENGEQQPLEDQPAETAIEAVSVALSAVPVAGGPLAEIAGAIIRRRQNRRLNRFLIDLAGDLQRLSDRVNSEFVRTDEFQDLAEDILTKATETRQQAKLDAFRAIFLNTVLAQRPNYNEASEIATLVDRLQEQHIALLRILADPRRADREMGRPVGEGGGFATSINQILRRLLPEWDDDQIDRTWADLLDVKIHNTPGTKAMMTDSGVHQLENRLTPFGWKVVRYITSPT